MADDLSDAARHARDAIDPGIRGELLPIDPPVNGEQGLRRDFILATLVILCLLGCAVILGGEYITGFAAAHTDGVLRVFETTILMILTGHFALARASKE